MITFADGPAAGVSLSLRRAPLLLRVVRSAVGVWDALDQLDDHRRPGETIHVYRMVGTATWMHLDGRDKAGRRWGRSEYHGTYAHLPDQPGDEHTRTNEAWRAWCDANKDWLLSGRDES